MKIDQLHPLLPKYLARQRWFAGGEPKSVEIVDSEELGERLHWLLVEADGARYQLLVGIVEGMPPEFLHGHDAEVLGVADSEMAYDGLLDPELVKELVAKLAPDEHVTRVRPMGAEQSNTSLVLDDRLVLKVFRRIHQGLNPDIEVTAALADAGFEHVAAPVATWEESGTHLAVVQPYLAGATDGWALALTSLRDLYANDCDDPGLCGGDFAAEARRLGEVTAAMHLAMAEAFGTEDADVDATVSTMARQLDRVGADRDWRDAAGRVFASLRDAGDVGPVVRVHGDYHLGQVVRTDNGWFVLDFEGEPARPLDERVLPSSPLKDVSGMLRSLDYAQAVALRDRGDEDVARCVPLGGAWEQRNRRKFLDGYLGVDGIDALLPRDVDRVLAAWELDKAVYEVHYELSHRPDWVDIPEDAIVRIVGGKS